MKGSETRKFSNLNSAIFGSSFTSVEAKDGREGEEETEAAVLGLRGDLGL
jgi:hypothetical protein